MRTLRSYVEGRWHEPAEGFVDLVDPSTEEVIGRASSAGVDFAAALAYARDRGRAALRERSIADRAEILAAMAAALHGARDELIALSMRNGGSTRKDAKFDLDGATFTLSHYAELGRTIGHRRTFLAGEGIQLGRSSRFWGQHVLTPLDGVAVHINAFNFPAWGLCEKAACAILAGMPVITKPATSTAVVAHRCVEILVEAGAVPDGVLSLICGRPGDLLDRLGPQDAVAFTGSAATALVLRRTLGERTAATRLNVEADSLNAAVLGRDVEPGGETWGVFVRDVAREITQKSGQKCTAVRRIFVPEARLGDVRDALAEALAGTVVGAPVDDSVTMGPLATAQQLADVTAGIARLVAAGARAVHGDGRRVDGVGVPAGTGFFVGPTLLQLDDPDGSGDVHRHEVFGPVATLMPYDGEPARAAELVARGEGTLVTSLYSDDLDVLSTFLVHGGASTGRLYTGSTRVAPQLPGSGVAMPHLLHGGPGRAGGGQELGGTAGLEFYLQRVAVTGDRALVERLTESRPTR